MGWLTIPMGNVRIHVGSQLQTSWSIVWRRFQSYEVDHHVLHCISILVGGLSFTSHRHWATQNHPRTGKYLQITLCWRPLLLTLFVTLSGHLGALKRQILRKTMGF